MGAVRPLELPLECTLDFTVHCSNEGDGGQSS